MPNIKRSDSMDDKIAELKRIYDKKLASVKKMYENYEPRVDVHTMKRADLEKMIKKYEKDHTKSNEQRLIGDLAGNMVFQLSKKQARQLKKTMKNDGEEGEDLSHIYKWNELRAFGFDIIEAESSIMKNEKKAKDALFYAIFNSK